MVRGNVYSHVSRSPRATLCDDSIPSDFSGSTSSLYLQKLASLELGGSTASVNGNPVIDLTHVSTTDELRNTRNQQHIVAVHDDASEAVSYGTSGSTTYHTAVNRSWSKYSQSSATSSYLPNSYKAYDYNDRSTASSRARLHSKSVAPFSSTLRRNQAKIPQAKFHPVESQRMVETLAKMPRTEAVQNVLGSFFQYVNPTIPGEDNMPIQSRSQQAAMKAAIRSEEDALDRVFNTVERFGCRDDDNIGRELREELSQEGKREPVYDSTRGSSIVSFLGKGKTSKKQSTMDSTTKKDMLDTVFEGVERFACRPTTTPMHAEKDALDRVFEQVEMFACQDDTAAASLHNRGMRTLYQHDPPTYPNNERSLLKDGDFFERFGRRFEQALCTSQMAELGHDGDLLDTVFEKLERTTCRDEPMDKNEKHTNFDVSVYDLDEQNSLLESHGASADWYDRAKHPIKRKPSWGNGQPRQNERAMTPPGRPERDMLDYVFENVEAGVCHTEENEVSPDWALTRTSLERIRALRQRLKNEKESCW